MPRDGAGFTVEDAAPARVLIDPTSLFGRVVPERQWIVQDWMPAKTVTLNYADGGIGKTLLAQQLMTACATGKPWIGLAVERCRSIGLFCEDDAEELHRRQDKINAAMGVCFGDLGDMRWTSGVGEENVLGRLDDDGTIKPSAFFETFSADAKAFGARLVIIDTAADVFGGNENDRLQVRQFINLLTKLAWEIGGAVLMNAHPSRAGLNSGNLDGGSTAWNNTCRSRWAMSRPAADADREPDNDCRVLSRRKANYAAIGTEIKLRWRAGALVPPDYVNPLAAATSHLAAEGVFLELLDQCTRADIPLSFSKNAGNFAPRVMAKRPDRQGHSSKELERAMQSLVGRNALKLEIYGRPADQRRRIVRADTAPDEAA